MKINLRKAAFIQASISKKIAQIGANDLSTTTSLTLFQEKPHKVVAERRDNFLDNLRVVGGLEDILTKLRADIGDAMASSGISRLLTEDATLKARLQRLERIVKGEPAPDAKEIEREVAARMEAASKTERVYGDRFDTILFNILRAADIEAVRRTVVETTRRRNEISDELLVKNVNTEINLSDDEAQFLREHSVI